MAAEETEMDRRELLAAAASAALVGATAPLALGRVKPALAGTPRGRARPNDLRWPSPTEWDQLRHAVGGRMAQVHSPFAECTREPDGRLCRQSLDRLANPFYIQDQAGGTQSAGWLDGWMSAPSVYAVEAAGPQDVAAAIDFARRHDLRLVVKGGAHSYLGQSNAPDSLMVWTRRMNGIELHDAFVPQGCAGAVEPQPAVSVGSGARFIELYDAVTTKAGRFVQGGGCTSVGVGGHVQTGGFGSFSKYGGLVAASLLEAEIVTADGVIRVVNACRDADLFAALKGGGAGFGITTRLTLATRRLPERLGFYGRKVKAASDAAFLRLIEAFASFAADALINPHWGEQVAVGPDNTLEIEMSFQGLADDEARRTWAPFESWLAANAGDLTERSAVRLIGMPGRNWWDYDYRRAVLPDSIVIDERPGAPKRFWWSGNRSEVGIFLSAYESLWLPEALLQPTRRAAFADALFAASRHFKVGLHFNKGLAGATEERRLEASDTAIHPSALDAFALAIIASGQPQAYPGLRGHEPDLAAARNEARRIAAATSELRKAAPEAGSYSSEMSYFEANWREAAWGPHYDRLLQAKMKYDPDGLFTGHHQVGSEFWSEDGFTRRG